MQDQTQPRRDLLARVKGQQQTAKPWSSTDWTRELTRPSESTSQKPWLVTTGLHLFCKLVNAGINPRVLLPCLYTLSLRAAGREGKPLPPEGFQPNNGEVIEGQWMLRPPRSSRPVTEGSPPGLRRSRSRAPCTWPCTWLTDSNGLCCNTWSWSLFLTRELLRPRTLCRDVFLHLNEVAEGGGGPSIAAGWEPGTGNRKP